MRGIRGSGEQQSLFWNTHLESLSVQSKFLDILSLEKDSQVWRRIMFRLPADQLSFLSRAGSDALPTLANKIVHLPHWKIQTDPSCPLCNTRPCTVSHILNNCPTSLNQGHYSWRHDSVFQQLSYSFVHSSLTARCTWIFLPTEQ